jgi:hypothetical protein
MRTGIANLPLHYGSTPPWLFERMTKLSREITCVIISEFGSEEMLKKLSDPFWFQAFGCVLGFDWHSSGLTTTVCGALKEGLRDLENDLGLFVCGGKGKTSRKTPGEIEKIGEKIALSSTPNLIYASKMSAKVDNTALQDGYQLYHHTFVFAASGKWATVQQGMDREYQWARRYHWLSDKVDNFVVEPEYAICCDQKGKTLNMVACESEQARVTSTFLSLQKPEKTVKYLKQIQKLTLSPDHPIPYVDIQPENLNRILLKTYEQKPENFEKLLGTKGVGPKTIRALSLISELVYGSRPSFQDPAKFSFAHGGKDGHPYPVDKENYNKSIEILEKAVEKAKIGHTEKLEALRRVNLPY